MKVIYNYVGENNMELGIWIFRQRKDRHEGKLSEDRIHRLDAIGMGWGTENSWEKNFEGAEAFCDKLATLAFRRNMSVKLASSSGRGFITNALFTIKKTTVISMPTE